MNILTAVLGADIYKDGTIWRTSNVDSNGATFAPLRVEAAAHIYAQDIKNGDQPVMLLQGGFASDVRPSIASVMRDELCGLGVPGKAIELEEQTGKTIVQLNELQTHVNARMPGRVRIVSNGYHLPRIQAMIECVQGLAALAACKPEFVSAEDVLVTADHTRWHNILDEIKKSADMQARVAKEEQGVAQIQAGTYRFE